MQNNHKIQITPIVWGTIILLMQISATQAEILPMREWKTPLILKTEEIMRKNFNEGNTIIICDMNSGIQEDDDFSFEPLFRNINNFYPKRAVVTFAGPHEFSHNPKDKNLIVRFKKCKDFLDMAKLAYIRVIAYVLIIITHDSISTCREVIMEKEELFVRQNLTVIAQENNVTSTIKIVAGINDDKLKRREENITESVNYHFTYTKKSRKNLKNKLLRVGVIDQYPYVKVPDRPYNLSTYEIVEDAFGADVEAVKIIAKDLNMTLKLHFLKQFGDNNDEYYANKSILQLFTDEKLEVAMGGLYNIYGNQVDYSGIYTNQLIFWVYSIKRDNRSWILFLARIHGYYIFVLFYVAHSLVGYLFNYDRSIVRNMTLYDSFFLSWGALLGCGSLAQPRNWRERFTNLFYSILCLYFAAYLSVQLYEFLTITPPPTRYNDNNAIMSSGKKPCMWPPLKDFNEDEDYIEFTKNPGYCDGFIDCARCIVKTDGVTPLMTSIYDTIQNILGMEAGEARLQRTQENLLTAFHEMILRKNNPLNLQFCTSLNRLFEAGIYEQLLKQTKGLTTAWKAQILNEESLKSSYSCTAGCAITLDQTAGLFYLLGAGWILSILVFAIEMCMKLRKSTTKKLC